MNRTQLEKLACWIAIGGAIIATAIVWADGILRPLAISDSLVALVRSSSEQDVYRDVAAFIRQGQMKTAVVITAIETAVVIVLFLSFKGTVLGRGNKEKQQ